MLRWQREVEQTPLQVTYVSLLRYGGLFKPVWLVTFRVSHLKGLTAISVLQHHITNLKSAKASCFDSVLPLTVRLHRLYEVV